MKIQVNSQTDFKTKYNKQTFSGALTKYARIHPMADLVSLRKVSTMFPKEKGFIGEFPREFVDAIRANSVSHSKKSISDSIELAKKAFIDITPILQEHENEVLKIYRKYSDNFSFESYCNQERTSLILRLAPDRSKVLDVFDKEQDSFLPSKDFIHNIETRCALILQEGLKKANVLPNDGKIAFKRLNNGDFGTVYKISFLDKDDNKLFKDKVIKYYRNTKAVTQTTKDVDIKKWKILHEHYPQIVEFQKNCFNKFIMQKDNPQVIIAFENYMTNFNCLHALYSTSFERYTKMIDEKFNHISQIINNNGIERETLVANYITHANGQDLSKSDLIKYHYSDIDNNFMILDFSSTNSLGKITKHIDYNALGVSPSDTKGFSAFYNFVDGRLIDYGNFDLKSKLLAQSLIARRIYKKIMHLRGKTYQETKIARLQELQALEDKAKDNAVPQSHDVLNCIKEIKNQLAELLN